MLEKMLQGIANDNNIAQWPTKNTAELHPEKPLGIFKKNNFFFPELERINTLIPSQVYPLHTFNNPVI
jgi:hypothetical protein